MRNCQWTRFVGLVLVLCVVSASVGCIGGNAVFHKVHEFNRGVSDNKFIQEIVFLVFNILPVYGIAWFGDLIIFNSIEFWTGDNPMGQTSQSLNSGGGDM